MNDGYYRMNSFEKNLETQDSSGLGTGTRARGDRTRRSWSAREEEVLMWTLKDLVARGWKSDNGFRSGYLTRIEEVLNREFPKSGIKGTPHVRYVNGSTSPTREWLAAVPPIHPGRSVLVAGQRLRRSLKSPPRAANAVLNAHLVML
ncbi:hypothetical protein SASPL_151190 [Salvia splendens]|uniref:Myb/SANT-like domain-containing protein n=1 Tax=Salvia splendens TaxID=180675 RepID=A0A8X8Z3I0_SALSN|nr:hypothetical protein SASPL_151190 [Salvia splendens]